MEAGNGLYLDNFAWRGNTGTSFRDISSEMMKDFNRYLDYKLIILSFGQNMVSTGNVNFGWYESQMVNVINDLKRDFPQASILLVSVGDRAVKKGTKFATDPNILKMVEVQKKIANSTGITFWNMFESMGGEGSIVSWANSGLAYKDYGHISLDGSKKVANMLSRAIIDAYHSQK
jgi:lysophospholipase L1-like esterase